MQRKRNREKRAEYRKKLRKHRAIQLAKIFLVAIIGVVILSVLISTLRNVFSSSDDEIIYASVLDSPASTPIPAGITNSESGAHLDRLDPTPPPAPEIDMTTATVNDYGSVMIVNGQAMNVLNITTAQAESMASAINTSASSLGSGVNVFSMIIPSACGVSLPTSYIEANSSEIANQSQIITTINDKLSNNIAGINIFPTLKANSNEKLYYNSEATWTSRGAYHGYSVWANRMGVYAEALSSYTENSVSGLSGSLQTFTGGSIIEQPENVNYYTNENTLTVDNVSIFHDVSEKSASDKLDVFFGGSVESAIIANSDPNAVSVGVIVGDASAYPLVPFIAGHYKTTYFIDYRNFEGSLSQIVSENSAVDVTYCVSIGSCASDTAINSISSLS